MENTIDYYVDKFDKAGDKFLEEVIKPIAKGSIKSALNDNKIAQTYLTLKTAFMENKIELFLGCLNSNSNGETIDFINELSDKEKKFFIESSNKVIDLDDELQIFIISTLVKSYQQDNQLNYFEKSLYYNISQISKEDFSIYYCFYSKYVIGKEKRGSFYIEFSIENKEIVEIVLKKFISFGIIQDKTSMKVGEDIKSSFRFSLSSYSQILYDNLNKYFHSNKISLDDLYKEYLPIDLEKNKVQIIKLKGF